MILTGDEETDRKAQVERERDALMERRTREGEIIRFMMTQRKEKMRKGKGLNGGGGMMDGDREHQTGDVNAAIYMLVITVI